MLSLAVLQGALVTYQAGQPVGRERFRDDGRVLTSEIGLAFTVAIDRAARRVTVREGETTVERTIPPGAVALENGAGSSTRSPPRAARSADRPRQ